MYRVNTIVVKVNLNFSFTFYSTGAWLSLHDSALDPQPNAR